MGRRRAKQKKIVTKKVAKLATVFRCLHCNEEGAVDCTLSRGQRLGKLNCRFCSATFQMKINYLHEPIDVYCEWIDSTEKLQRQAEADSYGGAMQEQDVADYDVDDDADVVESWEDRKRKMEEQQAKEEAEKQVQAEKSSSSGASRSKVEAQAVAPSASTAEEDKKNKEYFDDLFGESDSD